MYEIFAELLNKKGVTPYQVFKATGVAQSSLSDWKRGKSMPKIEKMKKIAEYFGVTVDYLMGEQKEKPATSECDELGELSAEFNQDFSKLTEQEKQIIHASIKGILSARGL